jgi:succinate dehydrogenase / fumarate reductase iron-sulfur subunit
MQVKCEIYKTIPDKEEKSAFVGYAIDMDTNDTVLDLLVRLYQEHDPTLSFRYACGVARCGECAMKINGVPCMACDKAVEPFLKIEPLARIPLLKDMVVNRRYVYEHIFRILPRSVNIENIPAYFASLDEKTSRQKIENTIRLTTCFECMICQSICPRYISQSDGFPGPLGLLILAQMRENPAQSPIDDQEVKRLIASCLRCGKCVKHCPANMNPLTLAFSLLGNVPEKSVRISLLRKEGIVVQQGC